MNKLIETLLLTSEFLMIIPLMIFCFIPVYSFKKSSFKNLCLKLCISITFVFIIIFLCFLFLEYLMANYTSTILVIIIFYYLYIQEINLNPYKLLFVFVTSGLIGAFSFLFYQIAIIFIAPNILLSFNSDLVVLFAQILFECLIIIILYKFIHNHLAYIIRECNEEKIWKYAWIAPTIFIVCSNFFSPNIIFLQASKNFINMYISFFVAFLLFTLLIYYMFYNFTKSIIDHKKTLNEAKLLQMQIEQYTMLQAHIKESNQIRHDHRHHLAVIYNLTNSNKYDELNIYLKSYMDYTSQEVTNYTSNPSVNALLCHYRNICTSNDVKTKFSILIPEKLPINNIDFSVILGNLLENALNSNISIIDEKYIDLKIMLIKSSIIMQIKNPYTNIILLQNNEFVSTKHNKEAQGLKSIAMIVDKYNGSITINSDNYIFDVKISLNI